MNPTNSDPVRDTLTKSNEDITIILESLAHKKRLQMLTAALERPQTFAELQDITELGKTALAHHLGILVNSGLLKHTGKGHYELSPDGAEFLKALTTAYTTSQKKRELETERRADYIQKAHAKKEEEKMKKLEVKITKLEPMLVASSRAVSTTPEHDAWQKLRTWAQPKGLLQDLNKHPVFGFNSPDPSPGQNKYGYEFWIRVDPNTKPSGDIEIKKFTGGLYAVTTCKLKEEIESEFFKKEGCLESWKNIVDWVKASKYKMGEHQCLEKAHNPDAPDEELTLDLYCPITE